MIDTVKTLFSLSAGFFRWWVGELAALVPPALRHHLNGGSERLLLDRGATPAQVFRLRGRKIVPLENAKAASARDKTKVTLALPRRDVVTRQAQLPLAAAENLEEVVGFEMDRLTPFSREEVYYACRITGRDTKTSRLTVDILLAPREKVDSLLDEVLGQGLKVTRLDIASDEPGHPLGVNLLPAAPYRPPSRLARVAATGLTATAAVLLFLALQMPLERKADYAAALDERVAAERARVAELRRLEEEIAALQKPDASLAGLKQPDRLTLGLIDQVTRLLPDNTWLNQLSLDGDRLTLSGFSPNSSKLITTFERSPLFTEAVFRSPVTQDPRLGLERFSLSMRVEPTEADR